MNKTPFQVLFEKLWEIIGKNEGLQSLLANKNQIRFDNELGLKDVVQHGDLPEVVLMPDGYGQETMGDSHFSNLNANFSFWISTGNKNPAKNFAIQWELFRCLQTFQAHCKTFRWNGLPFVNRVLINQATSGLIDEQKNRHINGWSTAWSFTVFMNFPKTELIYSITEES